MRYSNIEYQLLSVVINYITETSRAGQRYSAMAATKSSVTIRKSQLINKQKLLSFLSALGHEKQTSKCLRTWKTNTETHKDSHKNPPRTNIPNMGCTNAPRRETSNRCLNWAGGQAAPHGARGPNREIIVIYSFVYNNNNDFNKKRTKIQPAKGVQDNQFIWAKIKGWNAKGTSH